MPNPPVPSVDLATLSWRQGDYTLTPSTFVYKIDPALPLDEPSREAVALDPEAEHPEDPVDGWMVISQTCDIVKKCHNRPYVEVAPLVVLNEGLYPKAVRGVLQRYATVPALAPTRQAADLERIMTVEKSLLAQWPRSVGCQTDSERRTLAKLLARKRNRPALPDEFPAWFAPVRERLEYGENNPETPEGETVAAIEEILVQPSPNWGAMRISVSVWFVLKQGAARLDRSRVLQSWLDLLAPRDQFAEGKGAIIFLEDLTARDYVDSDRLDLDHMSPGD